MPATLRLGSARLRALLLCLSLVLPFTQFGAFAHGLKHAGAASESSASKDFSLHKACELCTAYLVFDGAASIVPPPLFLHAPQQVRPWAQAFRSRHPGCECRYFSRAPPSPLA